MKIDYASNEEYLPRDIHRVIFESFKPIAIILHGSRALRSSRRLSDWDYFIVVEEYPIDFHFTGVVLDQRVIRYFVNDKNIEFSLLRNEDSPTDIFIEAGDRLQHGVVVYDADGTGQRIMNSVHKKYSQPFEWPVTWPHGPSLYMSSKIDGMINYADNDLIFQKYFSNFSLRVFDYWFQVLHQQHSQPVYRAAAIVSSTDPEFYELFERFTSPGADRATKISLAKKIHSRIFGATNHVRD